MFEPKITGEFGHFRYRGSVINIHDCIDDLLKKKVAEFLLRVSCGRCSISKYAVLGIENDGLEGLWDLFMMNLIQGRYGVVLMTGIGSEHVTEDSLDRPIIFQWFPQ